MKLKHIYKSLLMGLLCGTVTLAITACGKKMNNDYDHDHSEHHKDGSKMDDHDHSEHHKDGSKMDDQ